MKAFLNSFMSRIGYVPDNGGTLSFNIDSASVDAAIVKLERLCVAAQAAEAATNEALLANAGEFLTSELVADETSPLILAELRKQTTLLEVLAKQGDQRMAGTSPIFDQGNEKLRQQIRNVAADSERVRRAVAASLHPAADIATGASASGLPG